MEGMPAGGTELPAVGAEIAGKYRIESVLGQGGMGAVFAARNLMTGKRVAIKWLLPEHAGSSTRERLLREARIAASIDHPNVVDIYDVGEHQGGLFLVMEYLRGKPLSDLVAERGRLDPETLIALLVPAMRGVHAAHQAGVIHRDLKPENIILSELDGQIVPKVVDFGVSKMVGASAVPHASLTRTGALVGTPHYMALEQIDGSNAIDARTDVYAFGVLLYRGLTGEFPFDGGSLGEVILRIGTKDPTPMRIARPELPAGLDQVVLRALSRSRAARFQDLEELARALLPFAGVRRGEDLPSGSLAVGSIPGGIELRGFAPPSVSDVPLGAGDAQRATVARVTPVIIGGSRSRRAFAVGALIMLGILGASALLMRAELSTPRPARVTAQPALPHVPSAPEVSATSATAAAVAKPSEPPVEPSLPVSGALEGSLGDEAALSPIEPEEVPALRPPLAAPPVVIDAGRPESEAREPSRRRRSREQAATPRPEPAARIPGDRTNGLSADEF